MGMLFEFGQHLQDKALIDTIDQYLATYCQKKGMTMVQLGLKAPKIVIEDCETGFAQEVCKLLYLCEAEGAKTKPTQKFLKACDQISKDLDVAKMTTFLQGVFELCLQQRPHHLSFKDIYFLVSFVDKNGKTFTLKSSRISDYSLCGLIWFSYFYDLDLAIYEQVLAKATSKLRYCGLRSPKLASSIFWLWFKIGSDKSIALLLRFRKKFRHKTLTSLIFRYISLHCQERSITITQLQEQVIGDFGFIKGQKTVDIGSFKVILKIESSSKVALTFCDSQGKLYKSAPSKLKAQFANQLKNLKAHLKEIKTALKHQKGLIESYYLQKRQFELASWTRLFTGNGLMYFFAQRLVWVVRPLHQKQSLEVVFREGKFWDAEGREVKVCEDWQISLWHPISSTAEQIQKWEDYIVKNQITQPFKQVFREIYTPNQEDRSTQNFSNRFAGNIVKQYQFKSLCESRHWSYTLLDSWDYSDMCGCAVFKLLGLDFEVIFKLDLNEDQLHDADNLNDSGVYVQAITDQIAFYREDIRLDLLNEVEPIVFSEIMRDCDLFVSVSNLGQDPSWIAYRQREDLRLQEIYNKCLEQNAQSDARNRALRKILPMLKIREVASFEGNFLVIKGHMHTYKIDLYTAHTFVMIESGHRYLCISETSPSKLFRKIFLPFEGDQIFCLILSKAFLLAEDHKITDETILNQLKK
jgi:hypothetical protein